MVPYRQSTALLNFEAFRLLNLELFEAFLLIKKLLIKKLGLVQKEMEERETTK